MSEQSTALPVALPQDVDPKSFVVADQWIRVAAYFIDGLPTLLLLLFAWIPVFGLILAGLVSVPYWLLRDITGASLGKRLLGLRVVRPDRQPASTGSRILRNLPLALPGVCMLIPVLGYFLFGPATFVVILVEGIMLFSQGERAGDRMAGTVVLRVAPSPAAYASGHRSPTSLPSESSGKGASK